MSAGHRQQRSVRLAVRVTPNERRRLARRAAECGVSLSDYRRGAALGAVPRRRRRQRQRDLVAVLSHLSHQLGSLRRDAGAASCSHQLDRVLRITDGRQRVKASRVLRRASYRALEQRFGMNFQAWRVGRRELLDAVSRYEAIERQRRHHERLTDRARVAYERAQTQVQDRRAIRSACRSAASDIGRQLRQIYRPADLPEVRRRLVADAREHGWREAGRRLVAKPRRYGRFRSPSWRELGQFRTRRWLRGVLLRSVQRSAVDLAVLRTARHTKGPGAYRAAGAVLSLQRSLVRAAHQRDALPSSEALLQRIAGKALALGVDSVRLAVAPEPLKLIRTALRAVELAREMGRGMSR